MGKKRKIQREEKRNKLREARRLKREKEKGRKRKKKSITVGEPYFKWYSPAVIVIPIAAAAAADGILQSWNLTLNAITQQLSCFLLLQEQMEFLNVSHYC